MQSVDLVITIGMDVSEDGEDSIERSLGMLHNNYYLSEAANEQAARS